MRGHDLLLRMAGRVPDGALMRARRTLATGRETDAIAAIAHLVRASPILLTEWEIAVIRDFVGNDTLSGVAVADEPLPLSFGFSAFDMNGEIGRDEIDEALVAAADANAAGLAGIWRTWRYFVRDDADQAGVMATLVSDVTEPFSPQRVYLMQIEDPAMAAEIGAELLSAVPDEGDVSVEIVALGAEPPPYQRAALAESRLLWARRTEPEFVIARVFDFADPVTGPGFTPDHLLIDDPARRESLLAYLRDGYPVLMTTSAMEDVLDPGAGRVVPASFRTDGVWIWTDAVQYYLSRYRLAPDPHLTEHIEARIACGRPVPSADHETAIRASDHLLPHLQRSASASPMGLTSAGQP